MPQETIKKKSRTKPWWAYDKAHKATWKLYVQFDDMAYTIGAIAGDRIVV